MKLEGRELARSRSMVVGPAAFKFLWFPVRVSHCRGRDRGGAPFPVPARQVKWAAGEVSVVRVL